MIETAPREQLTRFYRDWYRPDLMAVIVVGDVDRNAVAAMIRQHFSSLVNPEPERPRPIFDVQNVLVRASPSSPTRRARIPS